MAEFGKLPKQQWKEWRKSLFEQRGYAPWFLRNFGENIEEYDHFNIGLLAGEEGMDKKTAIYRIIQTKVHTFIDIDRPRMEFEIRFDAEAHVKQHNFTVALDGNGVILDVIKYFEFNNGARAQSILSTLREPNPEDVDWIVKACSIIVKHCYELHTQAQINDGLRGDSTRKR